MVTSLPEVGPLHLSPATSVTPVPPVFLVFLHTCAHWFSGGPSGFSIPMSLQVPHVPLYPLLFAIPPPLVPGVLWFPLVPLPIPCCLHAMAMALSLVAADFGLFLDAELCGLAQGPEVAVDAAQHRAVLTLDEKGVEAAGAMATSLARIALQLEALQPFLFVLWDEGNAIPLFMGRLSDPQA